MSTKTTGSTHFADLLKAIAETGDEADTLTKSAPAIDGDADNDDQTIEAAAVSSDDDKKKEGEVDPDFAKSMTMTDAAGNEVEAIDATEIIKSLQERVGGLDDVLAKSLGGVVSTLQKQGQLIKSLQDGMAKLASQGSGRKAVLMAVDKPEVGTAGTTMAKGGAAAETMNADEFFAKADTAFAARKITGAELNTIDVCRRMGSPIDPSLIRKVALS